MTRQRLTPEMIERIGLNQRVMNELVNDTLVVQSAGREGVRAKPGGPAALGRSRS